MTSLIQWNEFEQTLGDGEGQGNLVGYSPWDRKESTTTEQLNNRNRHCPKTRPLRISGLQFSEKPAAHQTVLQTS